jgi:hypothetical protein
MSDLAELQALRGLHVESLGFQLEPAVALGIVGGLVVAAGAILLLRMRPLRMRAARRALRASLAETRHVREDERLAAQALLLRRVARTVAGDDVAQLRGDAWLAALDRMFATTFFTRGEGRCFGDQLYAAAASDPEPRDRQLERLAGQLRS